MSIGKLRHGWVAGLVAGLGTAALVAGLALPGPVAAAGVSGPTSGGSLDFRPHRSYVGGQRLTLTGSLPTTGVHPIWVEYNMNRPGDRWTELGGRPFTGHTRPDGSFSLPVRAPDMWGISWRVRGGDGGGVTPRVTFSAKTQEVSLDVVDPLAPLVHLDPVAGLPFVIAADSTPTLFHRPDTIGLPVFVGRVMTLQRRVSPTTWQTVSTTTVGPDGTGYFPQLVEDAGRQVYRVRLEDWDQGGGSVGWTAGFPTYVDVAARPRGSGLHRTPAAAVVPTVAPLRRAGATTAATRYHWYPLRWAFDWESGEDLDSPPAKGDEVGHWLAYSDGTGRVSKHNGQLAVESGRLVRSGVGDRGTTRAIRVEAPDAYGRWEVRLRARTYESISPGYDVVADLVPADPKDADCGRRDITIGRWDAGSSTMSFGVNAGTVRWTGSTTTGRITERIPAIAVEVAPDHLTWFVDSVPVGTVARRAAVSGVPLALRLSLVGSQAEHTNTSILSDWQRSYDIDAGTQVTSGPPLRRSPLTACPTR